MKGDFECHWRSLWDASVFVSEPFLSMLSAPRHWRVKVLASGTQRSVAPVAQRSIRPPRQTTLLRPLPTISWAARSPAWPGVVIIPARGSGRPLRVRPASRKVSVSMNPTVDIDGVRLHLSRPDSSRGDWIGQREVLKQLLACWLVVDERDLPLAPRLIGSPGIGKTTLAIAAAHARKQELYIYQCTADTRPEDLLISPVLAESGKIQYQASPLVTAMIRGGVCVLDEGNRMNEKSWASLAPLLDHRRYVESIVAGGGDQGPRKLPLRRHDERGRFDL